MTDEDPITRIARAMCVMDGHDPEELIYVSSEVVEPDGAKLHREVMAPAWTSYIGKAARLAAAKVAVEMWAQGEVAQEIWTGRLSGFPA